MRIFSIQIPIGSAVVGTVVATISLLLVLASTAQAEVADVAAAAAPVAEAPAPVAAPSAAVEQVQASAETVPTAAATAAAPASPTGSASPADAAPPSSAPTPPPPAPTPTPVSETSPPAIERTGTDAVASVASTVQKKADEVAGEVEQMSVDPEGAAATVGGGVRRTAEAVGETVGEVERTGAVTVPKLGNRVDGTGEIAVPKLGQVMDRVGGTVAETVAGAPAGVIPPGGNLTPPRAVRDALEQSPAAQSLADLPALIGKVSGEIPAAATEGLPSAAGVVQGLGNHPAPPGGVPHFPGSSFGGRFADELIAGPDDLSQSFSTAFDGRKLLRLAAAGNLVDPSIVSFVPVAGATQAEAGGDGGHPTDRVPLEGPAPAPGSSVNAASGPVGSFFTPIAALFALLALVASAILRRLGEVPDISAPTPFVCALERPG